MGLIALPQRFLSQPQYAAKISVEYLKYSPQIAALGSVGINQINGVRAPLVNDAARSAGVFHFPGVNGYVDLGSASQIDRSNYSVIAVSRVNSIPAYPAIFGALTTTGGTSNVIGFYSTGGYSDITFGGDGAGDTYPLTQFGPVIGTWHNLVFRQSGSTKKLSCNGVNVAASVVANGLGGISGATVIGCTDTSSSNPLSGDIALFILFNGVLPDSLALKASANPWSVFQAAPRRLWVAGAASGSTGSSAGTSTVSGIGASQAASAGASSGVGTVSGVGAASSSSIGSSAGIATVSGIGAASSSSVGSSSGIAAVTGVGTSSTGSSGSAAGTSAVDGIGSSVAASVGSAGGIASVSGIGSSTASSVASSSGASTVSGVGDSSIPGSAVGSASGSSAVSGVGASSVASVGAATGTSTASGIAESAAQTGGHYAPTHTRKRKERDHSNSEAQEIRALLIGQLEEEIAQPEIPETVKQEAARIIKAYQAPKQEYLDISVLKQDVARVKSLLIAEKQRQQDEDEELLFMLL